MAKLESISKPAGFLAPVGRASQKIHVEEAHSCGEFLAGKGSKIICTAPNGEVGVALIAGVLATGGEVQVYSDPDHKGITKPVGAECIQVEKDATQICLAEIGHMWVMPPAFADLERYLKVWVMSGYRPLVCLSPRDEFLLLRGFVEEIVSAGSPKAAERLIFARSAKEGWEKLSELLDYERQ